MRECGHCGGAIPVGARSDAKFCSQSCRQKSHRRATSREPIRRVESDDSWQRRLAGGRGDHDVEARHTLAELEGPLAPGDGAVYELTAGTLRALVRLARLPEPVCHPEKTNTRDPARALSLTTDVALGRAVPCSRCGAAIGKPCRENGKSLGVGLHDERCDAVLRAGLLPGVPTLPNLEEYDRWARENWARENDAKRAERCDG